MRILVSACLLGVSCRYDGGCKPCQRVLELRKEHELIPVCAEQLGGLTTPRMPSERVGEKVLANDGSDRTQEYVHGAEQALLLYDILHCDAAILKARSPMCGTGVIYDGTFSGSLTEGYGVLGEMIAMRGIPVCSEETIDAAFAPGSVFYPNPDTGNDK